MSARTLIGCERGRALALCALGLALAAARAPAGTEVADAVMPVPPEGRTLASICVTDLCK